MRQRLSFLALTALSHGFVSAAVTGVARARAINAHALRYSAAQRGFSDSCLYLNSTTLVGLDPSEVPVGLPSDLDSCFCMSSLLESLTTSVQLAYTVNTLGITAVQQAFGFIVSFSCRHAMLNALTASRRYPIRLNPRHARIPTTRSLCVLGTMSAASRATHPSQRSVTLASARTPTSVAPCSSLRAKPRRRAALRSGPSSRRLRRLKRRAQFTRRCADPKTLLVDIAC